MQSKLTKSGVHMQVKVATYRTAQNFDWENIDACDEFPAIRQYFPYQIFCLVSYLYEMNE